MYRRLVLRSYRKRFIIPQRRLFIHHHRRVEAFSTSSKEPLRIDLHNMKHSKDVNEKLLQLYNDDNSNEALSLLKDNDIGDMIEIYEDHDDIDGVKNFIMNNIGGMERLNAYSIGRYLHCLGRHKYVNDATQVYEWCKKSLQDGGNSDKISIDVCNAILFVYTLNKMGTKYTKNVLLDIKRYNIEPDGYTYSYMMLSYIEVNNVHRAVQMFKEMVTKNIKPPCVAYINLFECFGGNKDILSLDDSVAHMFQYYKVCDITERTYAKLLNAYVRNERYEHAIVLLNKLREDSYEMNEAIIIQAIYAYNNVGDFHSVKELYEGMKNTTPSTKLYCKFLGNLPYNEEFGLEFVRNVHHDIQRHGINDDDELDVRIASAYMRYSADDLVEFINHTVRPKHNNIDNIYHEFIIKAYRHEKRVADAHNYLNEVVNDDRIDSSTIPIDCFNHVFGAYVHAGKFKLGRLVLRQALHELKLEPNWRTYNYLIRIAWIDQKHERALKYWRIMMKNEYEPFEHTIEFILKLFKKTNNTGEYIKLQKLLQQRELGLSKDLFPEKQVSHRIRRQRHFRRQQLEQQLHLR